MELSLIGSPGSVVLHRFPVWAPPILFVIYGAMFFKITSCHLPDCYGDNTQLFLNTYKAVNGMAPLLLKQYLIISRLFSKVQKLATISIFESAHKDNNAEPCLLCSRSETMGLATSISLRRKTSDELF